MTAKDMSQCRYIQTEHRGIIAPRFDNALSEAHLHPCGFFEPRDTSFREKVHDNCDAYHKLPKNFDGDHKKVDTGD